MGLATDWIARNVSRFRSTDAAAPATKSEGEAAKGPAPRGTAQRLQATLRRGQEVLSPRELRKLMEDLQAAADAGLSDVEGGRHAQLLMDWYAQAELPAHKDFWALIVEQFGPDTEALMAARKRYGTAASDAERGQAEMDDRKSTRLNSSHQIISYAVFCLKKKSTLLLPGPNARLSARYFCRFFHS